MSTGSRVPRFQWVPAALVGAAAAIAAEVALSLLLYGGPGLVRSLTTGLGVEGFAFAAGLWSAPEHGVDMVERVRRRWVLGLVAFLVAAIYGSAWTFMPLLGSGRGGQAAGLVIMAAAPLYAAGTVLGGMTAAAETDAGGRLSRPGAAAAAGAAVGFVLTGVLLPRAPMPGTMLVGCLVLLSVAGMVYGAVLSSRTEVVVLARRPSIHGEVCVHERRLDADGVAVVELLEGGVVCRWRHVDPGESMTPWDVAALRALMPSPESPWRVLHLGGGASAAHRTLVREHPLAEVDIAERSAAVIELGREYFGSELSLESMERGAVAVGNLDDLMQSVETTYDLLLVDLDSLLPVGGLRGLSRVSLWRAVDALAPTGVAVFGPGPLEVVPDRLEGWRREVFVAGRSSMTVFSQAPLPEGVTAHLTRSAAS